MKVAIVVALAAMAAVLAYLFIGDALGSLAPFVKAVPVALFAGLVFQAGSTMERRLAGMGLVISSLADAVIAFTFLGGLVGFLIAHIFYIAAFINKDAQWRLARLAPVALWALWALPWLVERAGAMAAPVAVYGVVIFTMIWRALAAATSPGWNTGTMGVVGALFFGISDTLLGYSLFVAPLPASRFLIMGTYWTAQALIAASFIRRPATG